MPKDLSQAQSPALKTFDRMFRETRDQAASTVDAELSTARKKIERLRALRLAKDAAEGVTAIDTKPKPRTTRTK